MVVAVGTACHAQLASIYCTWTEWLHIFVSLWVYLYTLPEVMQLFVRVSYLVVLQLAFETRVYGFFGIAWPNAPHRWLVQMTRWSRLAFQSCFRWYAEDLQGLQWLHLHEHCATRSSGDGLLSHYIQCLRFFLQGHFSIMFLPRFGIFIMNPLSFVGKQYLNITPPPDFPWGFPSSPFLAEKKLPPF